MTIQLTVPEALDYQKFEAELIGFSAGVAAALDYTRRRKIESIMQARKAAETPADPPAEAK